MRHGIFEGLLAGWIMIGFWPARACVGQEILLGQAGGAGRLGFDPAQRRGLFVLEGGKELPLGPGSRVEGRPREAGLVGGTAAMRMRLGSLGRVSGRVERIDGAEVRFEAGGVLGTMALPRAAVTDIEQRAGETVEFEERFERLDRAYWEASEGAAVEAMGSDSERHGLRLSGLGGAAELRLPVQLATGRMELSFRLEGGKRAGTHFAIEMRFGVRDARVITITPGWGDETVQVRSLRGPALSVQRMPLKPGWHRLTVRFDARQVQIGLDGADLAYGGGNAQGLAAVRFATSQAAGGGGDASGHTAWVDDLRILRTVESRLRKDSDPSQDDVRLAVGDQIFGEVREADGKKVRMESAGRVIELAWSEVSGIRFARRVQQPVRLEGDWVELRFQPEGTGSTSEEPDVLEGVLRGVNEREIVIEVAHAGEVRIARERLAAMTIGHRGWRLVIDADSYHLGDREVEELDPPLPEPEPFELAFELREPPAEPSVLALDVRGVEGVEGSPAFSEAVRAGELRTLVALNGETLGDLNSQVKVANDQPLRIRLPIAGGVLRVGRNVLRFTQMGTKDDPRKRDNLAIQQVAIEGGASGAQP
jgi:hypothetical protein